MTETTNLSQTNLTTSGTSDPGAANAGSGAAPPPAAFYEAFTDENLRTSPSIQRYKSVEELAKGFTNQEKLLGVPADQLIRLPADPNDADGMRGVYARLGLPEKPDGYGFQLGEKATDADKALVGKFAEAAHKAGMPAGMAKAAVEFFAAQAEQAQQARVAAYAEAQTKAVTELKTQWGAAYEPRMRALGDLMDRIGGESLRAELTSTMIGSNPKLIAALSDILEKTVEPGTPGGLSGDAADPNRPLTPSQASAAARALEADPAKKEALWDKNHPQHKAVVDERNRLLKLAANVVS